MKMSIRYKAVMILLLCMFSAPILWSQNGLYYDEKHNFLIPMTEDDELKGYAYVYKLDRVNKDSNSFIIEVYDQLLRDVGERKIVMGVGYDFHSAIFNGANYVLKFVKYNEAVNYLVFDQQAVQLFDTTLYVKVKKVSEEIEWNFNPTPLQAIVGQGIADYITVNDQKGNESPALIFLSNDFKVWLYPYESSTHPSCVRMIGFNNQFIVNVVYHFKGKKNSKKITTGIQVLSTGGSLVAEVALNQNDSITIMPIRANIEKGGIHLISQFTKRYGKYSRVKFGISLHDITLNGKIADSKFNEITETMAKDSVMKKHRLLVNSYLYMHNAIPLQNGNWMVAAEHFQKSRLKIDLFRKPTVKYNKQSICLIEVDPECTIANMHVQPSRPSAILMRYRHYRNPEMGAMIMHSRDRLDFSYFLRDNQSEADRISFIFTDYDAGSANYYIGNIIYAHDTFSVDKFRVKKFSDYTKIGTFPARFGRLLLIKYDNVMGKFDFDNIKFNN